MQTEKNYSIKKIKVRINQTKETKQNFKNFQTIRTFGEDSYGGEITLGEADEDQLNLVDNMKNSISRPKPKMIRKDNTKKLLGKTCTIVIQVEN